MSVDILRPRLIGVLLGLLAAISGIALTTPPADGADRVYWANFVSDKISYANIDGSGGVMQLNTSGATADEPIGLAIDPVGGRVYWANHTGGKISWANLDGSGGGDLATGSATVSGPASVSVDVAARTIYWLNDGADKISWAKLDGSGGGDLSIGAASIDLPGALAVFPSAGRVYWTNWGFIGSGWISYANLDGSGGATLPVAGATLDTPFGMGIDAAAGRLYWVNANPGIVSYANLDGSGASDLDDRGLEIKGPYGLALDPEAGRVYLANTVADTLAFVRLDETGGATLPFQLETNSAPNFPALLKSPGGRSAPAISRSEVTRKFVKAKRGVRPPKRRPPSQIVGVRLQCSPGSWAGDLVEAFLYQAPLSTTTQWLRDGQPIAGATSASITTTEAGNYRCSETAKNHAGATAQLSSVAAFFKVGGAKLNRRRGTARLAVVLPPDGLLTLRGRGIAGRRTGASGARKLTIKAKGRKKRTLTKTGKVRVGATLNFITAEAPPVSQNVTLALRKRLRR